MGRYNVNFCMTYEVEAKNEEEALDKANAEFVDDLPTFKVRDFGSNVEEVK